MGRWDKGLILIFDLDDTLMWTEYLYSLAFLEYSKLLIEIFQRRLPYIGSIAKRSEEISHDKIKEINLATGQPYGFSMNRYPDTLVASYKELCDNGFGTYDEKIAAQIRNIGMMVFDGVKIEEAGLVPGAENTLSLLRRKAYLILVTKGDKEVQEIKIKALNLERWFSEIRIVSNKTKESFLEFRERFPDSLVYSIGNSFSSDIKSALDAGLAGIFIPCYTWKAESIDYSSLTPEQLRNFIRLKKIEELPAVFSDII
ncbi:MAG: hypothetical protein A3B92_02965 [Candidatus Harrisonbacteria bacterium RIFCSPHIGHO2_02_FULL_42_16]|uniref:HAD family hydrolase n=1 Tax=Candidatus Harrisonbacteria bacterium RIFCSPHIGHO2_02_FULL_42_16 TaxID=1798404 RepID=A0A1G1ZID2_9BACT|nr:MAG: hypothetical protein A3B92_02965 [Candidatus Harrisonbacteria bacterium RIFCSPHIGHO2_02_FULL_42_16]